MVTYQESYGQRRVLVAGARRGRVLPELARELAEGFHSRGVGFLVGCAGGVDACFRAVLAEDRYRAHTVVGCAFAALQRQVRAAGLDARLVVASGLPARLALRRRTLWLVQRCNLALLFPQLPEGGWGPGSRLVLRSAVAQASPVFVVATQPPVAPAECRVDAARLFDLIAGWWVVPPGADHAVLELTGGSLACAK